MDCDSKNIYFEFLHRIINIYFDSYLFQFLPIFSILYQFHNCYYFFGFISVLELIFNFDFFVIGIINL